MRRWDDIRRKARERRAEVLIEVGDDLSAESLLVAADRLTSFQRVGLPAGDPLLDGSDAVLDFEMEHIWFNRDVDTRLALFYQAHEYAHLWLHRGSGILREFDLDPEAFEEPLPVGVNRVEGYGPEELREREANVFAREFLLPADVLRSLYRVDKLSARDIANRLELPEGLVLHQMARALLTRDTFQADTPPTDRDDQTLDASQEDAAHSPRGPLLVEAGPGTGKTRTLVARIVYLLRQNVPPSAILALTFSNRAAEEMRSRIAEAEPDAAQHIWIGTFHAFGIELLRKYGSRLGLPPRVSMLDTTDSVALLERLLPDLDLDHYQNLYDPAFYLRDIMSAISRAKDELVGPEEYTTLAMSMRSSATTPDETEVAERAIEVGRVYNSYQEALDREHLLDFGDLIAKSVILLQTHPDVRDTLRSTYRHVLVDEYQDVNRASGLLLKEVAGAGAGLWVVGDTRQAIYRFRGAAPANMRGFSEDFPGSKVKSLGYNYRSRPAIVDVFAGMVPKMRATLGGPPFTPWQPKRSVSDRSVLMEVANDLGAEAKGLAREIELQRAQGIPYREQAVLCRSHTYLGHFAAELELAGIPVLYLGDLFERAEVRDMLSLLSLTCEPDGRGLVRIARFPEYDIPLEDVLKLIKLAREKEIAFPKALELAEGTEIFSANGQAGLELLARHLDGLTHVRPWTLLTQYLFGRSNYLNCLLDDDSVSGQQRLLALYQILQLAHQYSSSVSGEAEDPKEGLLDYIRRLEIYGDERQLRQVPGWAEDMDAVRLLTIHASKGLEFGSIYLPALGRGIFPTRRQSQPCPPPAGMLASQEDGHDEEEECLFFVALSRARDVLCLSRARRYGARNSNPSDLLVSVSGNLPASSDRAVTWSSSTPSQEPTPDEPISTDEAYLAEELDVYLRCPRKYYYESALGLGRRREDAGYVQFHRCVYRALRWMAEERASDLPVDESDALARLSEFWGEQGPIGHVHEELYRKSADFLVQRGIKRLTTSRGPDTRPHWEVELPLGRVLFTPDHIEAHGDGSEIVERIRTGRPTKSETNKDIYALYLVAAQETEPLVPRSVQVRFLSTDEVMPVKLGPGPINTRLRHYNDAIGGILRKDFSPKPNNRDCPRCPHYFICPLGEDA